ncbi:MAG: hypothetical protein PHR87_13010, partial [Sulfurospirillaceae bacterium]|nr:hypothetical protein [Sulfurospirillaceae bacterium]
MGFSSNPPQFNFGSGKIVSVDNILSKIEEVNELPVDSINASFKMRVNDTNEQTGLTHNKADEVPPPPPIIIVPQSQPFVDVNQNKEILTSTYDENRQSYENEVTIATTTNPIISTYTKPYSHYTQPNDFNAYKPDVEMIPKPDVEMIPKPDVEMMPKNDFTDYFPENDFTDYFPENNNEGAVNDAAKPAFYFKATAHQVRYSEILNEDNVAEILGGGGSINGYKFDSITNQFEPETIDMSARTENMVIKAENTTYFSNLPATVTGIHYLTFKDLVAGQSVTVDGLTLTANGAISAADVAAAFDNLAASSDGTGIIVANGTWSGALSAGWSSSAASDATVTFTSNMANTDISIFNVTSSGNTTAAPADVSIVSTQGDGTHTEEHILTFQDLIAGQSVTV